MVCTRGHPENLQRLENLVENLVARLIALK